MPSPINIFGFVITFWLDLASRVVRFPHAMEIYKRAFWRSFVGCSSRRIIISDVGTASEKTVLIVDNQTRETATLQKQLAFAGFKTEIGTTGAGAIKIVQDHPRHCIDRSQLVRYRQR